MQIVLSGLMIGTGIVLIGLSYHNTVTAAWNVLIGKSATTS